MKKVKKNISNIYPLSPMQEGMLFHFLENASSQAYVQQISWLIDGHLDIVHFEAAWNELIRRHDILRTLFSYSHTDTALQVVVEQRTLAVQRVDVTDREGPARDEFRDQFKQRQRLKPFDLERDTLIRLQVLVLGDASFEVVLTHHHIIMDGWSLGNLVKESLDIYRSLIAEQVPQPPDARPYRDYIKWLGENDAAASSAFWKDYIADYETQATPPQISYAETPDEASSADQQAVDIDMDVPLLDKLSHLARSHSVTLNTVLQAIWGVLLCRYNNVPDVVFGAVVSGRPSDLSGVERMVGIFINTVAVRVRIDQGMSLAELLKTMQQDALSCEPHHAFPLSRVQGQTSLRGRLLGSLFVMENYPLDEIFEEGVDIPGAGFSVAGMETWEKTHFDFGIRLLPDDGMKIKIGYNTALYSAVQMRRLGSHLLQLAGQFADLGGAAIVDQIEILDPAEKKLISTAFNDTSLPFARDKTLPELFDQQVKSDPDALALVFADERLSYGELNARATAVAAKLRRDFDLRPDQRVGLLLGRSHWSVIGILAVLKAGAAYVPMEASLPEQRIRHILTDSGCRVLLSDHSTRAQAENLDLVAIVNVEDAATEPIGEPLAPLDLRADHLAYVIYTSGSSGEPKGVMIEQRSVVNLATGMDRSLYSKYRRRLNLSLVTTYVFDASVQQIFSALLFGHALHIMDDEIKRDTRRFREFCLEHRLDISGCIPNFLTLLHEAGELPALKGGLSHMIFGGEPLPRHLVAELLSGPEELSVSNHYGPTECCVNATTFTTSTLSDVTSPVVSIGKPLANVTCLILNRWGGLAPLGVAGELCIAGAGVGRGYLNNDALTREKFVPYSLDTSKTMFKTGDMARWQEDGNIEFLGRNDNQVKILGYRIEPAEIEEKLERHALINQAAVVPLEDQDGRISLRACVSVDGEVAQADLRAHLSALLPPYMIPARFMFLDSLPTLVSGKIDRIALAALEQPDQDVGDSSQRVGPRTAIEKILLDVWCAVFANQRIGVEDDYFALGGDSIRAIQIVSRLHREGLKIEIKDLFNHPTIAQLAPLAVQAVQKVRQAVSGEVALTPVQKHFFEEFSLTPNWFNHAVSLHARSGFDEAAAAQALVRVCQHHDALRMRFSQRGENGQWVQEAAEQGDVIDFQFVDIRGCADQVQEISDRADDLHRSFDLQTGPLAKAVLLRGDDGDQLLIVVHHLVIDGVSWRILLEDFSIAYEDCLAGRAVALPDTGDSLKQWGAALHQYARSPALQKQQAYWLEMEKAQVPPLPPEIESPNNRHGDVATHSLTLSPQQTTSLLSSVNHAYGTTVEEILLVCLARALSRWKDITTSIVILEGHGREPVLPGLDVNRTLGWFTSMYPLLLDLPTGADTGHQIKSIKESLRQVPDKGFGYGILKYLTPASMKDGLTFISNASIRFNYMGQFGGQQESALFRVVTDNTGQGVNPEALRNVDIDVSAIVLEDRLELGISCSKQRFVESSVQRMLQIMADEISDVCNHCENRAEVELTPADLTSSDISLDELEELFS